MEKGQILDIDIFDLSGEGQGIGRADGMVVFVGGTVPGDRAKVQLTKVKKNYAFGKLVEILEKSPDRVEELCEYHTGVVNPDDEKKRKVRCGGCPYADITYSAQLLVKENQVKQKLSHLAGIDFDADDAPVFNPIVGMSEEDNEGQGSYRYRNKAVMPVSTGGLMTRKGGIQDPVHEPRIGFLPAKSHDVIDCQDCWLQALPAMAAADAMRRFMVEDNITSYDERWDKGLMKSMTVKTAFGTGDVMVVLEINGKGIPNAAKLIEMLSDAIADVEVDEFGEPYYGLESVALKITKASGKVEVTTLAGKNTITDVVNIYDAESGEYKEMQFEISPESFYQVNQVQMQRLYSLVREYCQRATYVNMSAGASDGPVILDLYCGIGTIGLCLADMAEKVVGIEIVKDAIIDANRNAVINGIVNARYICGKSEEIIPSCMGQSDAFDVSKIDDDVVEAIKAANIAVLDPPRAGCRPELLETIVAAGIDHIIYVSCDPATLARDIKMLAENGFRLEEVTPVDLFPHTSHVETVCLMSRKEK